MNSLDIKLCLNIFCISFRRLDRQGVDWRGRGMSHCKSMLLCPFPASSMHGPPIGGQANVADASGIWTPLPSMMRCLFNTQTPSGCLPAQMIARLTRPGSRNGKSFSKKWWNSASSLSDREHRNPPAPKVILISFKKFCRRSSDSTV